MKLIIRIFQALLFIVSLQISICVEENDTIENIQKYLTKYFSLKINENYIKNSIIEKPHLILFQNKELHPNKKKSKNSKFDAKKLLLCKQLSKIEEQYEERRNNPQLGDIQEIEFGIVNCNDGENEDICNLFNIRRISIAVFIQNQHNIYRIKPNQLLDKQGKNVKLEGLMRQASVINPTEIVEFIDSGFMSKNPRSLEYFHKKNIEKISDGELQKLLETDKSQQKVETDKIKDLKQNEMNDRFNKYDGIEQGVTNLNYIEKLQPNSFVLFYLPDCVHCKKYQTTFKKTAFQGETVPIMGKDERVKFIKVNCEEHKQPCIKLGLNYFPSLIYINSKGEIYDYDDKRTQEAVLNFLYRTKQHLKMESKGNIADKFSQQDIEKYKIQQEKKEKKEQNKLKAQNQGNLIDNIIDFIPFAEISNFVLSPLSNIFNQQKEKKETDL